jgi:hypothetical protein
MFALSHNYYASAASLNEMGAAWVTKASDTLLLLPGFKFSEIEGCVDPREMGISFGMDDSELKHRLNGFKIFIFRASSSDYTKAGVSVNAIKFIKPSEKLQREKRQKKNRWIT